MTDFYRLGIKIGWVGLFCTSALSCYANGWSEDFLGLTGTTIAFDSPIIQNALINDKSPDLGVLLQKTGLKPWAGARIWLVQSIDNKVQAFPNNTLLKNEANRRGLSLNTTLNDADKIPLQQALEQPKTNALKNLLAIQHSDALVVLTNKNNNYSWQLVSPPQQYIGTMTTEGLKYLPHIWSENLAMSYQWPELKKNILVRINGIRGLAQFKTAEAVLKTGCSSLQVLHVSAQNAYFSCQSSNNTIPEKFKLTPQLVPQPLLSLGLDDTALMGQQLAQRYIAYQWRDLY